VDRHVGILDSLCGLKRREQADPVVERLPRDPIAHAGRRLIEGDQIADADEFFDRLGVAPDVDEHVRDLVILLLLLVRERVRRDGADDAGEILLRGGR